MRPFDYVFIASGTLGCLGSFVIILTHILLPSMRTPSRRLLVWLSLCDCGQGLFFAGYLGGFLADQRVCLAHHLFGVFTAAGSFWWTACIAAYVLFTLCSTPHPAAYQSRDRFTWLFHLIAWGYPLALVLPYRFYDLTYEYPQAGGADGWFPCIRPTHQKLFFEYELPLLLCWILTVLCYGMAVYELSKRRSPPVASPEAHQVRVIMIYVPLVFVLLRLGGLVELLLRFWGHQVPEWLMYVRAVGDPSQGFFNAIGFVGLTPAVRSRLLMRLQGYSEDEMILSTALPTLARSHQANAFSTPPAMARYGTLSTGQHL
jgi:hypothetical protein